MRNKGRNIKNVGEGNKALILKLVYTGQCSTRAELSDMTGLTKMTVGNIVHNLIENKWIAEGEIKTNSVVGRNPVLLCPDENNRRVMGVYISRDKVVVSSITPRALISKSIEFRLDHKFNAKILMSNILESIQTILDEEGREKFIGIGVSCIGPVDSRKGRILSPTDFYGISNVEVCKWLEKKTNLNVLLENDMNASALAEHLYGKGMGCSNFTYIGITHGIGAGMVINGDLYSGAHGCGGELGHISIDVDGPVCSCGNRGCIEVYASIPNFMSHVVGDAAKAGKSILKTHEVIAFEDVIEAAKTKDKLASLVMDEYISRLASAIASGMNLIDPEIIFIGHDAAIGGDWFAGKLEKEINERLLFGEEHRIKVEISAFGEAAPVIGSGVIYLNKIFHSLL
ncbi:MAG: ROK family protein [Eubacteriales bacterium]|nr:ROK family protein [Eubacteriales bacterium]